MPKSKQANLCRHLIDAAANTPQALAVAVQRKQFNKLTYREINFAQLNRYSDQIAYALNQHGLKRGDKAVLMVTPCIDFFALTFALFKAGIIPILVDPGMGIKNLKQCFIESKPDIFIGIPKAHLARLLFSWGKKTVKHNITVGGPNFCASSLKGLLKKYKSEQAYPVVKLDADAMAAILFTSGSTGAPKGVVYSHAMFEAQIRVLKKDYAIENGERDLATFPLFSLFGPALGMASIIPDMDASKPITADPENIFAAIDKYRCSNMFVNPALMDLLGKTGLACSLKLPSLKRIISAGAPATLPTIKRFGKLLNQEVPILNSYGATESLPISKIASKQLLQTEVITDTGGGICVGHPVDGVEIAIIAISEEKIKRWSEQLQLPPYQIGEIVVKGPQVSESYYCRDEATQLAKIQDADAIRHRMGDLGYLDEFGKLWMCGRKAHRVESNANGQNKCYYSIPCERIFNTHPAVKRSALVAVTKNSIILPLVCIELAEQVNISSAELFNELQSIAKKHPQTTGIKEFLIHPDFPVDIRHNAKIFREKLAVWAQQQISR
jgi:acyl-coenzyme A synthetase/AMP-(fatty) acid ligase